MIGTQSLFNVENKIYRRARILKASRVPEFGLLALRTVMRQGLIEPLQVQRALQYGVSLPNTD